MTGPLPPEPDDRLRARRAVAATLRWPADALDACLAVEADHPGWTVFWTRGWGESAPTGFRASHRSAPGREVRAASVKELRGLVEEIDTKLRPVQE